MAGTSRERFFDMAGLNPGSATFTQRGVNGSGSEVYKLGLNTSIASRFEGTDAKFIELPLNATNKSRVTYKEGDFISSYQTVEEMIQALDIGRSDWNAQEFKYYNSVEAVADSKTVKPQGLENTPADQVAKLGFVEAITAYSFAKLIQVRTFEGKDTQRTLVTVSDAKDEMGKVRDNMLGLITRAVKSGNYESLEKKYKLNLEGVNLKLLRSYAGHYLTNPRDEGNSLFCMDPKVLTKINEEIDSAKSDSEREKLLKVKKALGGITQAVYSEIDKRIDDTALGEIEQIMRNQLNFVDFVSENPLEPRKNTIVMINGHTGAGKGTTLAMLGTKAVETGTDGIAGRGEGFEQYELVMGPYDLARITGEFIPSKVMKLLFATEMMAARQKLDQDGRVNEPVYVSGFPRSAEQAAIFDGINNIKSVALAITEKTAVTRTLTRIGLSLRDGQSPREDDFNDLDMEGDDKKEVIEATVGASILINKHKAGDFIVNLSQHLEEKVTPIFKMNPKSRYYKYDNAMKSINSVLQQNGIETHLITCDGKNPEEVTAEVKQAIGI